MKLEELIPSYSHLNRIYKKSGMTFGLKEMNEVNLFFSCYSNLSDIEKAIAQLVGSEQGDVFFNRLEKEAVENLSFYSNLDDIIKEKENFGFDDIFELNALKTRIKKQTEIVNEIYQELSEIESKLDWPAKYRECEIQALQKKYDILYKQHKDEQTKLKEMNQEKQNSDNTILKFMNSFYAIEKLDKDILDILKQYILTDDAESEEVVEDTPIEASDKDNVSEDENEDSAQSVEPDLSVDNSESEENTKELSLLKTHKTGLTIQQNLKNSEETEKIITIISEVIQEHRNKKTYKTIASYCIIALIKREKVLDEAKDNFPVLLEAFYQDFFRDNDKAKYTKSNNRVIRSYRNKDIYSGMDPDERWGTDKEILLQAIIKRIDTL